MNQCGSRAGGTGPWSGDEQMYTNIGGSFPSLTQSPSTIYEVGYLSSFCCASSSSSSFSQMTSAFPCWCEFALKEVLLNKRSQWLAPPRRTSLETCPTVNLHQGLHFPSPSLLTLLDEIHREQTECWQGQPHSCSAGFLAPAPACSAPSHQLGIPCPGLLKWLRWSICLGLSEQRPNYCSQTLSLCPC